MDHIPDTRPSLLIRLRDAGDEQAWKEFVGIYEPVIHRLARRRGFQDADARELAQEVFVAVAGAIDRFELDPERAKFRTWLFRIAHNMSLNLLARRTREPSGSGDTEIRDLIERQPAASEDSAILDEEYRREMLSRAVQRVCGEFRDATWDAFWRTCVRGEEIRAVASSLGMSAGAVYIARSRVMARLRSAVEQFESD